MSDAMAMENLRKAAKALDDLFAVYVVLVYKVSGMTRPNEPQAALFAVSETHELVETIFGKQAPLTWLTNASAAIAEYTVERSGSWKRSHPKDLAEVCAKAEKAIDDVQNAIRLIRDPGRSTCTRRMGLAFDDDADTPAMDMRHVALEAGQTALMALQSAYNGEDERGKIPRPFEAVAEWAIALGERD